MTVLPDEPSVDPDGKMSAGAVWQITSGISLLRLAVSNTAHAHGWWEDGERNMGEMIALMHSELSEALEAWRDGDNVQEVRYEYPNGIGSQVLYAPQFNYADGKVELGKPVGVASEFADVIIRILDTCHTLGIPIEKALVEKAAYNLTRPYRHGGKKA